MSMHTFYCGYCEGSYLFRLRKSAIFAAYWWLLYVAETCSCLHNLYN